MSDLFGSDGGEEVNQGDAMPRASSSLSSIGTDVGLENGIQTPPQSPSTQPNIDDNNDMVAEGDDLFGSDTEGDKAAPMDYSEDNIEEEEAEEAEKIQVHVMTAQVPPLPVPHSDADRYILARTPNILQLDPTPFTADTYEDLIAEENEIAEKHGVASAVTPGLSAAVEGIIANTVRWRRKRLADGTIKRESNARLVNWSDGTTSVVIGSGYAPENYSVNTEVLTDPTKKEQHSHVAVHYPRELLMQSHARLTEQWLFRPPRQSAQTRSAVSLLLDRVKSRSGGGESAILGESAVKNESKTKSSRTRFMVVNENPELMSKRAEEEEERRERQRKKEERMRERMEARSFQQQQQQHQDGYGGEYSDNEEPAVEHGYGLEEQGYDYERTTASSGRRNYPTGGGRNVPDARHLPPRSNYIEDDLDGFIDDDEPEVGPRDEFDIEEEEEEEEELAAAARLKDAKRYQGGDHEEEANRVRGSKSRRVMDSDEED